MERGAGKDADTLQTEFIPRIDPGRAAFRFADALNAEMAATDHREVYVYIHGYFNSFTDCVETATSLHHYNGRRGAVIAFAWPSRKHLLDYFADRESAQFSAGDLRQMLVFLSQHTDAERIHLIAHSMGTYLTSTTLRELRLIGFDKDPAELQEEFRIGEVVLVAPDIDVDVLQKVFFRSGFHQVAQRMTLYVSPDDRALSWATRLLFGVLRAGSATADYLDDDQKRWLKAEPSRRDDRHHRAEDLRHRPQPPHPEPRRGQRPAAAARRQPGPRAAWARIRGRGGRVAFPQGLRRAGQGHRRAGVPGGAAPADAIETAGPAVPAACCVIPDRFAPAPTTPAP